MRTLLIIIALAGFSQMSYSQSTFTARDAYPWALNKAQGEIGSTAELKAVAIQRGIKAGQITTSFDPETGEANAWLYSFVNDQEEVDNIIAVWILAGFADATDFGADVSTIGNLLPIGVVGTENWINSDLAGNILLSSSTYQALSAKYPNAELSVAALGNNDINSDLTIDDPYWLFTFVEGDEDIYMCDVHAEELDITCFDLFNTSVEEQETADFYETGDGVTIEFKEQSLIGTDLYVYDVTGKILAIYKTEKSLHISKEELPGGVLFLSTARGGKIFRTAINNVK